MPAKSLDQHIEATPDVCGGKPRVAGRRITVQQIAVWHERMGKCVDEIATEYELELADVHAALAYYFDHRVEIDAELEDTEQWIAALKSATPSLLQQKLRSDAANDK